MSYQVKLKPSEHVFSVEENEFILDAALRQGIAFPYQCKTLPLTVMEHEHQQGKAVFCVSVAKSDLELEVNEISSSTDDVHIKTLPARVNSLNLLADDVMEMTLKLPASERMSFHAGQYIEFIMRNKSRRAFSLANSPNNDEYLELHLRRVEKGIFTGHVFDSMKEKAVVRIEGPFGSFFIRDTNRPLILIAGGTGFAPIKSMVEDLIGSANTRTIKLYWGARAQADLYHNELAEQWASQYEHIHYIPVLSEAKEEDSWSGRTGYVHEAVANDIDDLTLYDVYMAGPPVMINAAKEVFFQKGLAVDQLFSDSFEYANQL